MTQRVEFHKGVAEKLVCESRFDRQPGHGDVPRESTSRTSKRRTASLVRKQSVWLPSSIADPMQTKPRSNKLRRNRQAVASDWPAACGTITATARKRKWPVTSGRFA